MRLALLLRVFAVANALNACASEDRRVVVEKHGCGSLDECAISNRACQTMILEITACVRGDDVPPLPPIRQITREQLREELRAETDSSLMDADEAAQLSNASLEKALEALRLLKVEGSLADANVDGQAANIAAFYRLDKKDITVISDTTMERLTAMNELAHEFTHYLQDRAGQLEMLTAYPGTVDKGMARRALVEGEATVTSYRVSAQMAGVRASDVRWSELFDSLEESIARSTNASKSPLVHATSMLLYGLGSRAIEQAWEQGGRASVDALFDEPPESALEWVADRYAAGYAGMQELECNPPLPPDGFELVGVDRFGLVGVYSLLGTQNSASLAVASDWRQDLLAVYRAQAAAVSGEPSVLAVWRIRFADQAAQTIFRARIAPLGLQLTASKNEVTISVSSDANLKPLNGAALAECPAYEELAANLPTPTSKQVGWCPPHAAGSRWFKPALFTPPL